MKKGMLFLLLTIVTILKFGNSNPTIFNPLKVRSNSSKGTNGAKNNPAHALPSGIDSYNPAEHIWRNFRLKKDGPSKNDDSFPKIDSWDSGKDSILDRSGLESMKEKIKKLQTKLEKLENTDGTQKKVETRVYESNPSKTNLFEAKFVDELDLIDNLKNSYDDRLKRIISNLYANDNRRMRKNEWIRSRPEDVRYVIDASNISPLFEELSPLKFQKGQQFPSSEKLDPSLAPTKVTYPNLLFYSLVSLLCFSLFLMVMNVLDVKNRLLNNFRKLYNSNASFTPMNRSTIICEMSPNTPVSPLVEILHNFKSFGNRFNFKKNNLIQLKSSSESTILTTSKSTIKNDPRTRKKAKNYLRRKTLTMGSKKITKKKDSGRGRYDPRNLFDSRCKMGGDLKTYCMNELEYPDLSMSLRNFTTMKTIDECNILPLKKMSHLQVTAKLNDSHLSITKKKNIFTKGKSKIRKIGDRNEVHKSESLRKMLIDDEINYQICGDTKTKAHFADKELFPQNGSSYLHTQTSSLDVDEINWFPISPSSSLHRKSSDWWDLLANKIAGSSQSKDSLKNYQPSFFEEEFNAVRSWECMPEMISESSSSDLPLVELRCTEDKTNTVSSDYDRRDSLDDLSESFTKFPIICQSPINLSHGLPYIGDGVSSKSSSCNMNEEVCPQDNNADSKPRTACPPENHNEKVDRGPEEFLSFSSEFDSSPTFIPKTDDHDKCDAK